MDSKKTAKETIKETAKETLPIIYARAKKDLNQFVMSMANKTHIPFFLLESIMSDILSDIRKQAYIELAAEEENFSKEKQKEFDNTVNSLIKNFEGKEENKNANS